MKKSRLIVGTITLVLILVTGLGGAVLAQASEEADMQKELQKVTVVLDYIPNTNHSGMYVALDRGYYEEEGLDVEIIEPTAGATNALIANGVGTFGIAYQEDVTLAVAAEEPLPIRAIATIIQHNTSGFVTLAGSGIESPADWEGKTYAGWGGPGENAVLRCVMEQAGADPDKLNLVIADGLGIESLGRACDIMWYFEAWDCVSCQMAGIEISYIPCRDLDKRLDYYTPVIVANTQTLENDPEMVKAFLRATARGYQDCIEDPDGAAEILHKYAPDYDLEMLKISQGILADKYMEDADTWGIMKDEVWDNYTDFMVDYDILEEEVPADALYTNQFLEQPEN